jgi:hypothetical protein
MYLLTVQRTIEHVKESFAAADAATISFVLSWLSGHLGLSSRTPLLVVLTSSIVRGWVWRVIMVLAQVHSLQAAAGCGIAFSRSLLSLLEMHQVQHALGAQACLDLHIACIESKLLNWAASAAPAEGACPFPAAMEGAAPSQQQQQQGGVAGSTASASDALGEGTADKLALWRSAVEFVEGTPVQQVRVQQLKYHPCCSAAGFRAAILWPHVCQLGAHVSSACGLVLLAAAVNTEHSTIPYVVQNSHACCCVMYVWYVCAGRPGCSSICST